MICMVISFCKGNKKSHSLLNGLFLVAGTGLEPVTLLG